MTRADHLAWAKQRALDELGHGNRSDAIASMLSDLSKHPELENHLGKMLFISAVTHDQVPRWIEGFN